MKRLKLSPDVLALNPGVRQAIAIEDQSKTARVPRADADERVGLTALMVEGWSPQSPDSTRYRLYKKGVGDTGLCETLKEACKVAKALQKGA